jgi:hypothetical protein
MYEHLENQVAKYKEYFAKNTPDGMLDKTILMLRLINRNEMYAKKASKRPTNGFTNYLKSLIKESAIARYQTFKEHSAPFDESNEEEIIDGLVKLADMIKEDIDLDIKYFRKAFAK